MVERPRKTREGPGCTSLGEEVAFLRLSCCSWPVCGRLAFRLNYCTGTLETWDVNSFFKVIRGPSSSLHACFSEITLLLQCLERYLCSECVSTPPPEKRHGRR